MLEKRKHPSGNSGSLWVKSNLPWCSPSPGVCCAPFHTASWFFLWPFRPPLPWADPGGPNIPGQTPKAWSSVPGRPCRDPCSDDPDSECTSGPRYTGQDSEIKKKTCFHQRMGMRREIYISWRNQSLLTGCWAASPRILKTWATFPRALRCILKPGMAHRVARLIILQQKG